MLTTMNLRRGTNISHWLSQSKRRGDERRSFFTRKDVRRIADYGFDHVRLPIDEEQMFTPELGKETEAFDLMDAALDWCDAAGLAVIVDLHILRSHHFLDADPPLYTDKREAERFAEIWRRLAAHLRGRDESRVAFELMNEPVAKNHDDWNRVAMVALAAIRESQPTRTVVLGSNRWSHCDTFDALRVPADPNLILTFHFYNPMLLTHYRASWCDTKRYEGPVSYPGWQVDPSTVDALPEPAQSVVRRHNRDYGRDAMTRDLSKPLAVRARTNLPLYCGEFGCVDTAPLDARLRWYRDLVSVFDEHDIAWSNWDWKGSFGIVDAERRDTGIAAAVLGATW
jgi:endoglucanase